MTPCNSETLPAVGISVSESSDIKTVAKAVVFLYISPIGGCNAFLKSRFKVPKVCAALHCRRDTSRLNQRRSRDRGCPRETRNMIPDLIPAAPCSQPPWPGSAAPRPPCRCARILAAEAAATALLQPPGVRVRRAPLGHRNLGCRALGAVLGHNLDLMPRTRRALHDGHIDNRRQALPVDQVADLSQDAVWCHASATTFIKKSIGFSLNRTS